MPSRRKVAIRAGEPRGLDAARRGPFTASNAVLIRCLRRIAPSKTAATKTAFISSTGPKGLQERRRDPPGNGILHQINLERMSPVVQVQNGVAFPDTLVGTDSHTPMVDALGVIAIGVGGLEAESVMLGRASWMRLPDIIGVKLSGKPSPGITATDIVLALTEFLRKQKVVSSYLEFFGKGASHLTLGDRATISNMAPEFGSTRRHVSTSKTDHQIPETHGA
jgi:aconitase A